MVVSCPKIYPLTSSSQPLGFLCPGYLFNCIEARERRFVLEAKQRPENQHLDKVQYHIWLRFRWCIWSQIWWAITYLDLEPREDGTCLKVMFFCMKQSFKEPWFQWAKNYNHSNRTQVHHVPNDFGFPSLVAHAHTHIEPVRDSTYWKTCMCIMVELYN